VAAFLGACGAGTTGPCVTAADQAEAPPETPVREGAPTFERFLAEIRSPAFRKKPEEEH
jgi:hypothetical protein